MKKISILATSLVISTFVQAVPSGGACTDGDYVCQSPIQSGSAEVKATHWYTGLIWELGGIRSSNKPDLVFGIRQTTTKNIDTVRGADASIRVSLDKDISLDSVRLSYLGGKPAALAQLGAGYSFKQNSLLATGAVQGNYFRLSTDYLFNANKFQYFGEINSLKKPKNAGGGASNCPAGYESANADEQEASNSQRIGNVTCVADAPL